MTTPARLRGLDILAYAAGSFGTGVFSTVPTVLLLYFCTEVLRIEPGWAAALVIVPKIWAIGWDPFVGAWSDRTVSPWGRRRPFLIVGAIGIAIAFTAVFSPPSLGHAGLRLWVGFSYFGLATLYSLFAVPYVAIPAQLGEDPIQRSRLVAWRMAVAMVGVMAGAGAAPLIVQAAGGGRGGYGIMAPMVASICALAMMGPILMLRGRDPSTADRSVAWPSLWRQLARAVRWRSFRLLAGAYLVQLTAVGAISAAIPYLVTKAFGRSEGDIGLAMLAMLGATTISVPVWAWVGRRLGEARALGVAVIAFGGAAGALGWAALAGQPWLSALPLFAAIGLPFAGMQVLPYILMAHLVHAEAGSDGDEGVFTGVWTATEKLGLATGPGLVALTLAATRGDVVGVAMFSAIGPGLLALASLPILFAATPRGAPPSLEIAE